MRTHTIRYTSQTCVASYTSAAATLSGDTVFISVSVGATMACAVKDDGTIYCWSIR
jgi:hypothetical protein